MTMRLAIGFLLGATVLLGADVTGTWLGGAAPLIVTLRLQQTSNTLSGFEEIAGTSFPVANGRVEGDQFSFTISIPAGGRLRRAPMAGIFRDGAIHLRIDANDITLKRVEPAPDAARIERLASLIRLWGTIRFFHPYVASRPIDWDAAFIAAIGPVEKAATKDDFVHAISGMLTALGDRETRVLEDGAATPVAVVCQCRQIVRSGFFDSRPSPGGGYYVDWENVPQRTSYIATPGDGIRVAVRTAESVSANTAIKTDDNPYAGSFPSREYRLLALARYWNAIHYFYGYPDSLEAWDSALEEFIPQFEVAKTMGEYRFTIGRLASRTHDGHSFIGAGTGDLLGDLGPQPDIALRNIDGQIVVTYSGTPRVAAGDVVRTVDGKPAVDHEKSLAGLFPSSTPWFSTVMADRYLLAGGEPRVSVSVRKRDGVEEQIELERDHPLTIFRRAPVMAPTFGKLPSGLGYIDLTRLQPADLDRAFDSMMDAPGIIFDLRGSVSGGAFAQIASRLTDRTVPATLIRHRIWHGPDPSAMTNDDSIQYAYPAGKPAYRGRVAVLIDASAFSQSEHTGLFLEAATKAVFVGTPTSGTDGEVTSINLPGGVPAHFAAMSVRHADGRPLQRVGILPDVRAEPAVSGIQQGRDEVLEKAVSVLLRAQEN